MSSSAARTFRFLTASQVQRLHMTLIANAAPTQPSLLESAVASPMNVNYYSQQNNVFQLAAILSEKIMKNHSFMDGNKRTALVAADMFLKINGYNFQAEPPESYGNNERLANAQVAVAAGQWDAEKLGKYYEHIATPIDAGTE